MKKVLTIALSLVAISLSAQKNVIPKQVPMEAVLANPFEFDSCLIIVNGFFHYKFEDKVLYPSKDRADYLMIGGVWVELDSLERAKFQPAKFDNTYVEITGIFFANTINKDSPYRGELRKVRDFRKLRKIY